MPSFNALLVFNLTKHYVCEIFDATSSDGVLQGSNIDLHLFLLYIHDLADLLNGNILTFVYDVKFIYPHP